ncbi:MAG: hypothetical protein LBM77_13755 [Spirochaetaceae bacterium]|nr:hypothetical protein [Spirochaetaceae bacterium]
MVDWDKMVLDEYEQDIEDHAEEWVPVSAEEDAKIRALLRKGKPEPAQPMTFTVTLDAGLAQRLSVKAQEVHETPAELAVEMLRHELAYA